MELLPGWRVGFLQNNRQDVADKLLKRRIEPRPSKGNRRSEEILLVRCQGALGPFSLDRLPLRTDHVESIQQVLDRVERARQEPLGVRCRHTCDSGGQTGESERRTCEL